MNSNDKKTNTLAILGFIFSFLISIVGLILSILGLNKSKETNSGRGLSIAGIIISSISIVMSIIVLIFIPYFLSYGKDSKGVEEGTTVDDDVVHYRHTFNVSPDNLYVDLQEERMKNYSRETKISLSEYDYYIKDGLLLVSFTHRDETRSIDLNGEQAKYLGFAQSGCSGSFLAVLTQSGNIYKINAPNSSDFPKKANLIYNKGDATEIVTYTKTNDIYMTCSYPILFALVDNQLYYISSGFDIELKDNYETRDEFSPYSVVFDFYIDDKRFNLLLYPDGSLNKYIYGIGDIENDFVTDENGDNILVSFIFYLNNEVYVVDIKGDIYKIVGLNNYDGKEVTPFTVEKEFSFKVKSVDVDFYKGMYEVVLNFNDGSKKEYSTKNGDNVEFGYY